MNMGIRLGTLTNMIIYIACFFIVLNKLKRLKCDQIEYRLIHSILKDYDSSIRPSLNHNYTLNVTFGLALHQIIDVVWLLNTIIFYMLHILTKRIILDSFSIIFDYSRCSLFAISRAQFYNCLKRFLEIVLKLIIYFILTVGWTKYGDYN